MLWENNAPNAYIIYDCFSPREIFVAFSLKHFYREVQPSAREMLPELLLQKSGFSPAAVAKAQQVHGAEIAIVSHPGRYRAVDGLASCTPGLFLAISVADCLPIFLWGRRAECVAVIHAGWRGTVAGIAANGIRLLQEKFSIDPMDIAVLLGPCICQACYEVGPEVAAAFDDTEIKIARGNRRFLDLRFANRRQLLRAGVAEENIFSDDRCTRCRQDLFFSYRVDGDRAGRMTAVIGIRP